MKLAFKEMDDVYKLTQSPEGFEFLDIGCVTIVPYCRCLVR